MSTWDSGEMLPAKVTWQLPSPLYGDLECRTWETPQLSHSWNHLWQATETAFSCSIRQCFTINLYIWLPMILRTMNRNEHEQLFLAVVQQQTHRNASLVTFSAFLMAQKVFSKSQLGKKNPPVNKCLLQWLRKKCQSWGLSSLRRGWIPELNIPQLDMPVHLATSLNAQPWEQTTKVCGQRLEAKRNLILMKAISAMSKLSIYLSD